MLVKTAYFMTKQLNLCQTIPFIALMSCHTLPVNDPYFFKKEKENNSITPPEN